MSEQTIARGQDVMVQQTRANTNLAGLAYPSVASQARYLFLAMPVTGITGQTVVAATLSVRLRNATANQQLAVQPVAAKWSVDKITWNNQPGVRAQSTTANTGAQVDGARVEVDMTALVQQIADGQPHYGWRVATTGEAFFYGFATAESWILTVETSEAPLAPTALQPSGGVVSRSKFVIRTDFTDVGGETAQSAIQVQVDPDQTAPYAFDSGEVATTTPELDLATTSYPGLADGATTSWRARVKDVDGYWSPWSAWATVTRAAKPTLTLNSPTGETLGDPTATVQATLAAGTIKFWDARIVRAGDSSDIRWESGRQAGSGTSFITTIPAKYESTRVFTDDGPYRLRVRVWDRLDRVTGGPDDPPHIAVVHTFAFEDDSTTAPSALALASVSTEPAMQLTWTRSGSADGWVIHRDGILAAILGTSDVTAVGAGQFRWVDREGAPNRDVTWQVRAIVNGKRSNPISKTGVTRVDGLWLLSRHGNVQIIGLGTDRLVRKDKRATYSLPGRPDDVDIIGAQAGIAGPYAGTIGRSHTRRTSADVDTARAVLAKIRRDATTPVRLVYGTVSVPVLLRDLSVTPSPDHLRGTNDLHDVSFECWQVGDFEVA